MDNEISEQENYDIFMELLVDALKLYLQDGNSRSDLLLATADFLTMNVLAQTNDLAYSDQISAHFAIIQRQFSTISSCESGRSLFDV